MLLVCHSFCSLRGICYLQGYLGMVQEPAQRLCPCPRAPAQPCSALLFLQDVLMVVSVPIFHRAAKSYGVSPRGGKFAFNTFLVLKPCVVVDLFSLKRALATRLWDGIILIPVAERNQTISVKRRRGRLSLTSWKVLKRINWEGAVLCFQDCTLCQSLMFL